MSQPNTPNPPRTKTPKPFKQRPCKRLPAGTPKAVLVAAHKAKMAKKAAIRARQPRRAF